MVFNFIDTEPLSYGNYVLPLWAQAIGWMVALIPIILIPIYSTLVIIYDYMCHPDTGEDFIMVSVTLQLVLTLSQKAASKSGNGLVRFYSTPHSTNSM